MKIKTIAIANKFDRVLQYCKYYVYDDRSRGAEVKLKKYSMFEVLYSLNQKPTSVASIASRY